MDRKSSLDFWAMYKKLEELAIFWGEVEHEAESKNLYRESEGRILTMKDVDCYTVRININCNRIDEVYMHVRSYPVEFYVSSGTEIFTNFEHVFLVDKARCTIECIKRRGGSNVWSVNIATGVSQ